MRVTLDYDFSPEENSTGAVVYYMFRMITAWLVLKALRGEVYVRRSASGRFHMKAHGLKIGFWTSILLRCFLGDDKMRIRFDIRRMKKPKQILWSEKNGKEAGEWIRI